ncbi:MAG: 5-(carboxyamino)imidazole ribonucleotide synthase [Pseudomonadota bacterium]
MSKRLGSALPPRAVIGILGGGQLGRMLALAASDMGYRVAILAPEDGAPAFDVAWQHIQVPYTDTAALDRLAETCSVITYEFENVPADTAEALLGRVPLAPQPHVLATTQDRALEKMFLETAGIAVAPWRQVDSPTDLDDARTVLGSDAILKTRRLGYDGKGQTSLSADLSSADAFDAIGNAPAVLEARIPFEREISVIGARDWYGGFAAYDPGENVHHNHILATTDVPAGIAPETAQTAIATARAIAKAFDYIGVFGVEFFVVRDGDTETLLVNEIAPRVHNSGHWTQAACPVNQFAQHIRCVAGWPVGDTRRLADTRMTNLLGDTALDPALAAIRARPGSSVHLYGKADARPGRKMGHVTEILPRRER